MDPYATLGVVRDADPPAIRKAYRRKAKAAHPDVGGSAEQFNALTLAHAILSDPDRRARYDATGDASEATPDNRTAHIVQLLSKCIDWALGKCAERQRGPEELDFCALIGQALAEERAALRKRSGELRQMAQVNRMLEGRFKLKASEADDILTLLVRSRVADAERALESCRKNEAIIDDAVAVLKRYAWVREEEAFQAPAGPMYGPSFVQIFSHVWS